MGQEIDLLVNYPRTKRNVDERGQTKSEEDRAVARQFGKEFFDGDRRHGYGGFNYMARFWQPVIPTFQSHFGLDASSSVLDVGCAKGFMLHDMAELIPGITVKGVDISEHRIRKQMGDLLEAARQQIMTEIK
jgi:2-polyprenyl-3-methyl-5-hydroxy-6-metoxy-1,4-benzoquinol methylase